MKTDDKSISNRKQEVRMLLNTIQAAWICGEEMQEIVEAIDRIYTKENVEVKTKNQTAMKTYVLLISRYFPAKHPRAGRNTYFVAKICKAIGLKTGPGIETMMPQKIHTIRANYDLWVKRAEEINAGGAVLSIRYWSGRPYQSKQLEFCKLERIGIQKLGFSSGKIHYPFIDVDKASSLDIEVIAQNDGLSLKDFEAWFKGYDLSKPMAIIHFTDFRY